MSVPTSASGAAPAATEVESIRPRLREDLTFHTAFEGEAPVIYAEDPLRARVFSFRPEEYRLAALLDGERELREVARGLIDDRELDDEAFQQVIDYVHAIVGRLNEIGLLEQGQEGELEALSEGPVVAESEASVEEAEAANDSWGSAQAIEEDQIEASNSSQDTDSQEFVNFEEEAWRELDSSDQEVMTQAAESPAETGLLEPTPGFEAQGDEDDETLAAQDFQDSSAFSADPGSVDDIAVEGIPGATPFPAEPDSESGTGGLQEVETGVPSVEEEDEAPFVDDGEIPTDFPDIDFEGTEIVGDLAPETCFEDTGPLKWEGPEASEEEAEEDLSLDSAQSAEISDGQNLGEAPFSEGGSEFVALAGQAPDPVEPSSLVSLETAPLESMPWQVRDELESPSLVEGETPPEEGEDCSHSLEAQSQREDPASFAETETAPEEAAGEAAMAFEPATEPSSESAEPIETAAEGEDVAFAAPEINPWTSGVESQIVPEPKAWESEAAPGFAHDPAPEDPPLEVVGEFHAEKPPREESASVASSESDEVAKMEAVAVGQAESEALNFGLGLVESEVESASATEESILSPEIGSELLIDEFEPASEPSLVDEVEVAWLAGADHGAVPEAEAAPVEATHSADEAAIDLAASEEPVEAPLEVTSREAEATAEIEPDSAHVSALADSAGTQEAEIDPSHVEPPEASAFEEGVTTGAEALDETGRLTADETFEQDSYPPDYELTEEIVTQESDEAAVGLAAAQGGIEVLLPAAATGDGGETLELEAGEAFDATPSVLPRVPATTDTLESDGDGMEGELLAEPRAKTTESNAAPSSAAVGSGTHPFHVLLEPSPGKDSLEKSETRKESSTEGLSARTFVGAAVAGLVLFAATQIYERWQESRAEGVSAGAARDGSTASTHAAAVASGHLPPVSASAVPVFSNGHGRVLELLVREGEPVHEGRVLAKVEDLTLQRQIGELRRQLAESRGRRDAFYEQRNLDAYRGELRLMADLAREIGRVSVQPAVILLRAPRSGVIRWRNPGSVPRPGSELAPGTPLLLVEPGPVEAGVLMSNGR